ncbi:MAG: hypothetical protein RLZZ352_1801 [Pseudomonadota bacterium]|jgi:superfamily II DNA or RNA helicase
MPRSHPRPQSWFNTDSLQAYVSQAVFVRGEQLQSYGSVSQYQVSKPGAAWVLEAEVEGSKGNLYDTRVELVLDPQGQVVDWWTECSCPMGEDCKHAVALTLHAATRKPSGVQDTAPQPSLQPAAQPAPAPLLPPSPPPDLALIERERAEAIARLQDQSLTAWLQRLAAVNNASRPLVPTPATSTATAETLGFVLHTDVSERLPLWHLRPVWLRRRTKGKGWLQPRTLRDAELPFRTYGTMPSGLDEQAQENLFALSSQLCSIVHYSRPTFELRGRSGLELVRRLAQQGCLLLEHPSATSILQPLTWCDTVRTLAWTWEQVPPSYKNDTAPYWKLSRLADGLYWGFNTPPLVVDPVAGLVGPADIQGLTSQQVRTLLDAPAMSEPALQRHASRLIETLGPVTLPPVLHHVDRLVDLTPRLVAALNPVPEAQRAAQGWVRAALSWDYDGHRVPLAPANLHRLPDGPNGQQRLLMRAPDQEAQALAILPRLGLHPCDGMHWGLPGTEDQTRWLDWVAEAFAPWLAEGLIVEAAPLLTEGWVQNVDQVDAQWTVPEGEESEDGDCSPWFDLSLGIAVDGQRINALPWLPGLLAQVARMPMDPDRGDRIWPPHIWLPRHPDDPAQGHLRLASAAIRPWLEALLELVGDRTYNFDSEHLRLSRLDALRAHAALGEGVTWQPDPGLKALLDGMRGHQSLPEVLPPTDFQAQLRPYQQQGLNWLQFLRTHGLAGVLADDMGLGKTVQTLAHVATEKAAGRLDRPTLIVAPVSLLGNWAREAQRFSPQLRTLVWHGQQRHGRWDELAEHDLVIAPYSLLQRDRTHWAKSRWHLVVLDEAQNIKNAATQAAQVACELDTRHRLCLSGTPMENHLGELWSLFHFLMPGFLGSAKRFGEWFRQPIEREGNAQRLAQLRARVTPFMLRRTKQQVVTELPPKQETVMRVELGSAQADLYESIRLSMESTVREALNQQGLARSQITILDALLKLRQVCCDPSLLKTDAARTVSASAKLEQLMDMLPEMLQEGRRILLFSQFTTMLARIEKELARLGLNWVKLTGSSRDRDALVQRFTSGEVPLFLISLKAGGVGLNLPQADTVIHFDPWWNPAVENQATDRAHRIGQTQRVWVIKLVAQGTIEERMLALQARKAELADRVYEGAAARKAPLFTDDDVAELLRPMDMERQ